MGVVSLITFSQKAMSSRIGWSGNPPSLAKSDG